MRRISKISILLFFATLSSLFISAQASAETDSMIVPQIFEKAKKNDNWKLAVATGKDAQVVFMNITPNTNPNNEIGMETHKFDQVVFIAEGSAKAIIDKKSSTVKPGDMIFIPQGTAHNFINLSAKKPLKIISVYSDTDIPEKATYKKKSDTPAD